MVSAAERGHLECDFFGRIILRRAEYHVKCDFSCTPCLPTGNDSSERRAALLNAAPVYFHFMECVLINEVQSATTIHAHFSEAEAVYNWV